MVTGQRRWLLGERTPTIAVVECDDEGRCLFTEVSDPDVSPLVMDPVVVPKLAVTVARLCAHLPRGFTPLIHWAEDPVAEEREVTCAQMQEIILPQAAQQPVRDRVRARPSMPVG